MLTPLFENKTILAKEVFAEVSQKTFKECHKKYRLFTLLMFIICILWTVKSLLDYHGLYWFSALMFLTSAFFLFMTFKGYLLKLNQGYKNFQGVYGKFPEFISKFYDEKIEVSTLQSNLTIEYSQVTKIIETENLYILMIRNSPIILIKSGFTSGSTDEFNLFINEKCKNA